MHQVNESYRLGWLRAFFDGEGSVSCTTHNRSITFTNTQAALIDECCAHLTAMGFIWRAYSTPRKPPRLAITHVTMRRSESLTRFIRAVGSSVPYKRKRMADLLRWFRRPGRARRTRWGGPSIPAAEAIGALLQQGKTHAEIAAHFGIRRHTMGTYIRAAGLGRKRRLGEPPAIDDVLAVYHGEGLSLNELGARFGYKGSAIGKLLKRHGVAAKPYGWKNRFMGGENHWTKRQPEKAVAVMKRAQERRWPAA